MGAQNGRDDMERVEGELDAHEDHNTSGRSGEGAASAMRHMISQGLRKWHHSGEAKDASEHAR